jgi:hypothetical protein
MASTPVPVNSQQAKKISKFPWDFIQKEKKAVCALCVDKSIDFGIGAAAPGIDLKGNSYAGSGVLIDYFYILCAGHSFQPIQDNWMRNKQAWAIFNNEYTEASLKAGKPQPEPIRPFAYLRGDIEWVGNLDCGADEDFALVRIEWHEDPARKGYESDYHLINHMADIRHIKTFNSDGLKGTDVCCIENYSQSPGMSNTAKPFHLHAAASPITGDKKKNETCTTPKQNMYYPTDILTTDGSSGSPMYNNKASADKKNKGQLLGINIWGYNTERKIHFLPLDYMYTDKFKSNRTGRTAKDIFDQIYKDRYGTP